MLYKCHRCNKEFNQKSNYTTHLNRKNPCKIIINSVNSNNIIESIITQENVQNTQKNTQITQENTQNLKCIFCSKLYSRSDALSRHIKNYCKENKIIDKLKKLENKIDILEQENESLKKQIIILPKTKTSVKKLKDIYKQLLFMFYDNKNVIKHKLISL